ncbi:MAG: Ig-like domain-containing protein [Caldilineaceae bacterium]
MEQFSKIAGRVTDNEGRPLENISVTIYGFHPTNNYWYDQQIVQTDGNGHYEFPTLVGGPYRLAFNQAYVYPPQYEPEFYQNAATLEAATTINLARSEVIDNVDVQLEQYAQIAGRVTDIHGQPIAGIDITPYQIFEEGASWNQLPGATTGPSGIYTLTGLVEGVYALSFQSACCQQRYVPEFYDDATDLYTGARLALARGQVLTGIDAQLDAYGTISGRVTNERGEPLYDIFVDALYPQEDAGEIIWNSLYGAYTDDNGEYQIEQLPANNYRVRFNYGHDDGYVAAYWQDTLDFDSATAISLPLNSVATGIDAQLVQGASLRGALQTVDGRVTNLGAWLYQYAPYTDGGDPWEPLQTDYGSYNGVFTFRGLDAGTYRLGFYDNQNPGYRREYYPDQPYVELGQSFELTLGQAITGISALLDWPTDQDFPPYANDDHLTLFEGSASRRLDSNAYSVLDNDKNDVEQWAEQLHATLTTPPRHGQVTLRSNGQFLYQHDGSDTTEDSFGYQAHDTHNGSNIATIMIKVLPVNEKPYAIADTIVVMRGERTSLLESGNDSLVTNDLDPEGDPLTVTLVSGPTHGALQLVANGTFTYTHDGVSTGNDSFTYLASDGTYNSEPATVTVLVKPAARFAFSKTVGIEGIEPACTPTAEIQAPRARQWSTATR